MNENLPYRPATDSITLRLDRWASILRNYTDDGSDSLSLNPEEAMNLSTLLTEAANEISDLRLRPVGVPQEPHQ